MARPKSDVCLICLSPYRREIVEAHNRNIPVKKIYDDFAEKSGYNSGLKAFYQLLARHKVGKHRVDAVLLPQVGGKNRATIEDFGKKLLELGYAKIQTMNPEDVALKDVIQAQKLVLDSKKLKLTEDAMTSMMGKFFAPTSLQIVEGEIDDSS